MRTFEFVGNNYVTTPSGGLIGISKELAQRISEMNFRKHLIQTCDDELSIVTGKDSQDTRHKISRLIFLQAESVDIVATTEKELFMEGHLFV